MNERARIQKVDALTAEITARIEAARERGDRDAFRELWNERSRMIAEAGLVAKGNGATSRAGQRQYAERRAFVSRRTR